MPPTVTPPRVAVDDNGVVCGSPFGDDCATNSTDISGLRPLESCDYAQGPWYVDYIYSRSFHGGNSKRLWTGYSGAPAADMECTTCHDPHGSYSPTNPAGNPYAIRDFVDGSVFVDDGVRPSAQWTGPPWDTMGVAREVVVAVDPATGVDWGGATGLCTTCHADWLAAYDWHAFCTACQTCHNHGQTWGNHDWGGGELDDTGCYKCGNDVLEGLEECDDANQLDGDGCSSECKLEL
jgi:cysteine-rich repeat protein